MLALNSPVAGEMIGIVSSFLLLVVWLADVDVDSVVAGFSSPPFLAASFAARRSFKPSAVDDELVAVLVGFDAGVVDVVAVVGWGLRLRFGLLCTGAAAAAITPVAVFPAESLVAIAIEL